MSKYHTHTHTHHFCQISKCPLMLIPTEIHSSHCCQANSSMSDKILLSWSLSPPEYKIKFKVFHDYCSNYSLFSFIFCSNNVLYIPISWCLCQAVLLTSNTFTSPAPWRITCTFPSPTNGTFCECLHFLIWHRWHKCNQDAPLLSLTYN